jgi:hypothetical protein
VIKKQELISLFKFEYDRRRPGAFHNHLTNLEFLTYKLQSGFEEYILYLQQEIYPLYQRIFAVKTTDDWILPVTATEQNHPAIKAAIYHMIATSYRMCKGRKSKSAFFATHKQENPNGY